MKERSKQTKKKTETNKIKGLFRSKGVEYI